jgi:arsenite methyltransferase
VRRALVPVRDEVLDRAELRPDDRLLDVGTGDGLIAFGALDRLGPAGRVIFSDISADLLDHCRTAAAAAGQLDRCEFVRAPADRLAGIGDASVDVVTTRSVYEPINRLMHGNRKLFMGYDIQPVADIAAKAEARFEAMQPTATDPMLDFDDRDLVRLAEQAGFADVRLDLRVTVTSSRSPVPWDRFLRSSPNPKVPPIGELLARALTTAELAAFTAHLRPLVESGRGEHRRALAYLTARDGRDQPSPPGPPG